MQQNPGRTEGCIRTGQHQGAPVVACCYARGSEQVQAWARWTMQ